MFPGRTVFKGNQMINKAAGNAGTKLIEKTTGELAAIACPFIPGISASLGETAGRSCWRSCRNYFLEHCCHVDALCTSGVGRKNPNGNCFYTGTGIVDRIVRFLIFCPTQFTPANTCSVGESILVLTHVYFLYHLVWLRIKDSKLV